MGARLEDKGHTRYDEELHQQNNEHVVDVALCDTVVLDGLPDLFLDIHPRNATPHRPLPRILLWSSGFPHLWHTF